MATKVQGPDRLRGSVNTPLPRDLAVQVRDATGRPAKDNWVSFTAKPPEAIEFAGGQLYATVRTDEKGIASVRITPRLVGQHRIVAEASDGLGSTEFTLEVTDCDGTEVRSVGDDILVINGGGARSPMHIPMGPIAAMVIAAIVVGGLCWLFGRDGGKAQPPIVVRPGPSSTVDATARADAQAARAAVDTARTDLHEEITTGLASNSAHDQGYGREYTRPTMRLALENARRLAARMHGDEPTAHWVPPICRSDPDLPACRE